MSSLKETPDVALLSHSQGPITNEELLLLLDSNTSRNPEVLYDNYARFDSDELEQAECKAKFRIEKRDIHLLADALGLPANFRCPQRSSTERLEGLCLRLKRISFPCRYRDVIYRFG